MKLGNFCCEMGFENVLMSKENDLTCPISIDGIKQSLYEQEA